MKSGESKQLGEDIGRRDWEGQDNMKQFAHSNQIKQQKLDR